MTTKDSSPKNSVERGSWSVWFLPRESNRSEAVVPPTSAAEERRALTWLAEQVAWEERLENFRSREYSPAHRAA